MATRSLEVTQTIRDRVLKGIYSGGTRLNEVELATALSVSRTPVRGALSTLATEGLLEYKPNCGYVVRRFTARDIANVYQVRAQLDGLATRLLAEAGLSDDHRGAMARVIDQCEMLVRSGHFDEETRAGWLSLNRCFHEMIYDACGNAYLASMLRRTNLPIMGHLRSVDFNPVSLARSHDDHVEIFDAITRRNPVRAEALSVEHVYRNSRRLVEVVRRIEHVQMGGQEAEHNHAAE